MDYFQVRGGLLRELGVLSFFHWSCTSEMLSLDFEYYGMILHKPLQHLIVFTLVITSRISQIKKLDSVVNRVYLLDLM